MATRNELIGYAMDFAALLVSRVTVDKIILYGSVARGDFDRGSDVDLFISIKEKIQFDVDRAIIDFQKTQKAHAWRLKGVGNQISCVVGDLDSSQWRDLKRAMLVDGLVLFGKYTSAAENIHQYSLICFEGIKPESKRVTITRALFGFRLGKRQYLGLAAQYGIIKCGRGSILVPALAVHMVKSLFKSHHVTVRIYDVWSDYDLR